MKTDTFLKLLRKFSALMSIASLLYATDVVAQINAAGAIGQALGTATHFLQQSHQQQLLQQQNLGDLSSLTPVPKPALFFPQCQIPELPISFNDKMCGQAITNPAIASHYSNIQQQALSYANSFTQLLDTPPNNPFPPGIACLQENKKHAMNALSDRIKALEEMITQVKQQSDIFRRQNEQLLSDMRKANGDLFGGGEQDVDTRSRDFEDLFDPVCSKIIGNSAISGGSRGLVGIMNQGLKPQFNKANDFRRDAATLESDFNNRIANLRNAINNRGIDTFRRTNGGIELKKLSDKFKGAIGPAGEVISRFGAEESRIKGEINNLLGDVGGGFTLPALDRHFDAKMERLLHGGEAEELIEKKFKRECVTLADKGVALPLETILESIKQPGKTRGNVDTVYRNRMRKILTSKKLTADQMLAAVKKLERDMKGRGIVMTYYDRNEIRRTESPYKMFKKTVEKCNTTFERRKPTINRLKSYLAEYEFNKVKFSNELADEISRQVLDCNDDKPTSDTCSASNNVMSSSSPNFCIGHATHCAEQTRNCYATAKALVEQKKQELKVSAARYNANVNSLLVAQNARLQNFYQGAKAIAGSIRGLIPKADFQIPKNLRIPPPKLAKGQFGVDLIGGGTLNFLDHVPNQLEKIKAMFINQQKIADTEMETYIAKQHNFLKTQRDRLDALANSCAGVVAQFQGARAQQQQAQAKQQQELQGEVTQFCRRFERLATVNPAAGCDGDNSPKELYEDGVEIAAHLNPDVLPILGDYENLCSQVQAEAEQEDEDDEEIKATDLAKACSENDDDWDAVKKDLRKEILANIPPELDDKSKRVKRFLDKPKASEKEINRIHKDLADTSFGEILRVYAKAHEGAEKVEKTKGDFQKKFTSLLKNSFTKEGIKDNVSTLVTELKKDNLLEEVKKKEKAVTDAADDAAKEAAKKALAEYKENNKDGIAKEKNADKLAGCSKSKKLSSLKTCVKKNLEDLDAPGNSNYEKLAEFSEADLPDEDLQEFLTGKKDELLPSDDDEKSNYCHVLKNEAIVASVRSCKSKDDYESCYDEQFEKKYKKTIPSRTRPASRAIASVTSNRLVKNWSELGEEVIANCSDRFTVGRNVGENSFGALAQELGLDPRDAILR